MKKLKNEQKLIGEGKILGIVDFYIYYVIIKFVIKIRN